MVITNCGPPQHSAMALPIYGIPLPLLHWQSNLIAEASEVEIFIISIITMQI